MYSLLSSSSMPMIATPTGRATGTSVAMYSSFPTSPNDGGRSKAGGGSPMSFMLLPRFLSFRLMPLGGTGGGGNGAHAATPSLAMYSLLSSSSMPTSATPTGRASGTSVPQVGGSAETPFSMPSLSSPASPASPNDGGRSNAGGGRPMSFMLLPWFLLLRLMPLGGTGASVARLS